MDKHEIEQIEKVNVQHIAEVKRQKAASIPLDELCAKHNIVIPDEKEEQLENFRIEEGVSE